MRADAIALEQAGAAMLLLECVPSVLAEEITQAVKIPVIGIGAGAATDGQVLVMHMLGLSLTGRSPSSSRISCKARRASRPPSRPMSAPSGRVLPAAEHGFNA